jgi:DnaJ-class molecular chaperone
MFAFKVDRSPFKTNPRECPACYGWGTTKETAAVRVNKVTKALGSGCPKCKGTGSVEAPAVLALGHRA